MSVEVRAETPVLYGQPLYGKKAAFSMRQGQSVVFIGKLMSPDGAYYEIPENATLISRYKECFAREWKTGENASVVYAAKGEFKWAPPAFERHGVYELAVAVRDNESKILEMDEFFIYVEPSPWEDPKYANIGVPSLDRVRLALRDSTPDENELWKHRQAALTEICEAVARTVSTWNETPPVSASLAFDTMNFPYQNILLMGVSLFLTTWLLEHYRKNSLPYQAAGIAVNDSKLQEYTAYFGDLRQQFLQGVMQLKSQLNLRRLFAIL